MIQANGTRKKHYGCQKDLEITNKIMEEIKEKSDKRICKYWLQIEHCRNCLFDALCQMEANNERIQLEQRRL